MRLLFLGPPGAGKGTQAKLTAEENRIAHISTGDMMRGAIAAGTALGKKAKGYMDKGELVPDALVIDLIKERLKEKDCKHGFLLDGFPRTLPQAQALDTLLKEIKQELTHIVKISVADSVLIDRLVNRGKLEGRSDDTREVIENRLKVYNTQTQPVVDYYLKQKRLRDVNGLGSVEEVQGRIRAVLG